MAVVCVDDCGLSTDEGRLGIDWSVAGMKRVCADAEPFTNAFNPGGLSTFFLLRDMWVAWTNTTCVTHRVEARMDVPWVKIKVGTGNTWIVRGYIDAGFGGGPPVDTARAPELEWTTNWYLAMPAGTDQEQTTPGHAVREYMVAPGDTITVAGRLFARAQNWASRPANLLAFSGYRVSISAWPSTGEAASGAVC